jgi:hypothetical protein
LVRAFVDDDEYRAFQLALILRPDLGPVMRGSGGLRKVRWAVSGRGKRGGVRIIYYWDPTTTSFYCLYLYPKNEQEDLTAAQLRALRSIVEEEFG